MGKSIKEKEYTCGDEIWDEISDEVLSPKLQNKRWGELSAKTKQLISKLYKLEQLFSVDDEISDEGQRESAYSVELLEMLFGEENIKNYGKS